MDMSLTQALWFVVGVLGYLTVKYLITGGRDE